MGMRLGMRVIHFFPDLIVFLHQCSNKIFFKLCWRNWIFREDSCCSRKDSKLCDVIEIWLNNNLWLVRNNICHITCNWHIQNIVYILSIHGICKSNLNALKLEVQNLFFCLLCLQMEYQDTLLCIYVFLKTFQFLKDVTNSPWADLVIQAKLLIFLAVVLKNVSSSEFLSSCYSAWINKQ